MTTPLHRRRRSLPRWNPPGDPAPTMVTPPTQRTMMTRTVATMMMMTTTRAVTTMMTMTTTAVMISSLMTPLIS
jgi:hypothetical protein